MNGKIVTLIPLRLGGDKRRWWLWDHTLPYLEALGYPVFTGDSDGEWARAQALNRASQAAGDWEYAIIGDADTIPDPLSIERALMWVRMSGGAIRPHLERIMLNQEGTMLFLRRGESAITYKNYDTMYPGGGLLVIRRDAWDTVGGYDERFVGWGHEDSAFNLTLLGTTGWDRLPGKAWHLWHPRGQGGANRLSREMYNKGIRHYRPLIHQWAEERAIDPGYAERIF